MVTEEIWRSDGNGNMFCICAGPRNNEIQVMSEEEFRNRGKGTHIKVSLPSEKKLTKP